MQQQPLRKNCEPDMSALGTRTDIFSLIISSDDDDDDKIM